MHCVPSRYTCVRQDEINLIRRAKRRVRIVGSTSVGRVGVGDGDHVRPCCCIELIVAYSQISCRWSGASRDLVEPVIFILGQKAVHAHFSSLDIFNVPVRPRAPRRTRVLIIILCLQHSEEARRQMVKPLGTYAGWRTFRALMQPGSQPDRPPQVWRAEERLRPRRRRS